MPHEITIREDGVAEAAFAEVPAWHGLGTVLDHPMTSSEALQAAHLDWTVSKAPIAVLNNAGNIRKVISSANAIVRDDNGDVLGIVSDNYKIINNVDAFRFVDSLVEEGQMTYEAAFSLRGGKTVVLLARMPRVDYVTDEDSCLRYILLSTTHDGTAAVRFGPTSVRVVCANTYSLAISDRRVSKLNSDVFGQLVNVPHKGNIDQQLERARRVIEQANNSFDRYINSARELAQVRWTSEQFDQFLNIMCPMLNPADPDYTPRRAKALEETRRSIRHLYYNHEWQNGVSVRRTAWAAVNAVVQHIDYLPRRGATAQQKAEARFNVVLYGPGRDMKQRAFAAAQRISQLVS